MGNEFTAADFSPHLVFPLTFVVNVAASNTAANPLIISVGGYHSKLRLRKVGTMRTDEVNADFAGILSVMHGANTAAVVTEGSTTDPIGHWTDGIITDAYKDAAEGDTIAAYFSTVPGAGGLLLILSYELIE